MLDFVVDFEPLYVVGSMASWHTNGDHNRPNERSDSKTIHILKPNTVGETYTIGRF